MKWIPCEERLPNDNREVLISLEWGIDIGTYERGEWRSEWINHYDDDNVLAWMPLPQPYTADRKTEPTSSKMEQVDKDINVRSKTENSSEKPNNCDTCRNKGFEGCEQPCLGCGCCGLYEAMTENDKLKEKVVDFIKTCARCKHRPIGAMMCEESCHYEPQPTTQTETQNSNLTFEKDECAKEYEELGLKELKELIEADRKTEPQTEREGE